MKKPFFLSSLFIITFFIYFGVSTEFSFKPKWFLDYYNPLAASLQTFRLDIQHLGTTYDLAYYKDKWYAPWGMLPAIFLMPFQLLLGRFVPALYLSLFFASLTVVVFYLILERVRKDFLKDFSERDAIFTLILFAFGTAHFYVGTLGGVWHVNQIVSSFFGVFGVYIILKKKRRLRDYFLSATLISIALLGRATVSLFIVLPLMLLIYDTWGKREKMQLGLFAIGMPYLFFLMLLLLYNYARFENPFEYGYSYMYAEPQNLVLARETYGITSFHHLPQNVWLMLFEIPKLSFANEPKLAINLMGNSILFLTPPFLTAFLAFPLIRKGTKFRANPYVLMLWITTIIVIVPSLLFYNSGWVQFGFRYALDIVIPLILLSLFGMKGKLNSLYIIGILFAIWIHVLGIRAMM